MVIRLGVGLACLIFAAWTAFSTPVQSKPTEPVASLDTLLGRWTGQGRLGFSKDKFENVTCRVTYRTTDVPNHLKQTIRCASASGKIEVFSELYQNGLEISGSWKETMHNMSGDLAGQITPAGFRVEIKGTDLKANMDIMVRGTRQLVEIQFHDSTMIGLSMMLTKG